MTSNLTPDEQETMRVAAHGVLNLMASADPGPLSSARAGVAGGKALSTATGLVGRTIQTAPRTPLRGGFAEVADIVLPALTATVATLTAKAPGEDENFRRTIQLIIDSAAGSHGKPVHDAVVDEIHQAMDAGARDRQDVTGTTHVPSSVQDTLEAWTRLWNGELTVAHAICAPDFSIFLGRAAVDGASPSDDIACPQDLADFIESFRAQYPGITYSNVRHLDFGDHGVSLWNADWEAVHVGGIDVFHFDRHGLISRVWSVTGQRTVQP